MDKKDLTWIKEGYFAHRGLHNSNYPENTMAAFKNAVEHRFDIEFDIRLTKDKKIVIIHDSNLKRLCNKDINVEDASYDEIKELTIHNTSETIPLLTKVMDYLPSIVDLLIELKPSKNASELVSVFLKVIEDYPHTFAIHSFDPRIVYEFKKQAPSIIRGQITSTFPNRKGIGPRLLSKLIPNIITKPDFINYRFEDLPRKQLDRLYQKGMVIVSYTARSQDDLDFVKKRYDNAVFENFIPIKKNHEKS